MRWTVGGVRTAMVREALTTLPPAFVYPESDLLALDGHEDWLGRLVRQDGSFGTTTHAFLLESQGKVTLVDTHVGPRATEYQHWSSGAEGAAWTVDGAARPLCESGAADLVKMDDVSTLDVRLIPSPGHSPGSRIRRCFLGQRGVAYHRRYRHHRVQFIAAERPKFFHGHPEAAMPPRNEFVSCYADIGLLTFESHYPADTTGFVEHVYDLNWFVTEYKLKESFCAN